jgi:propanol-preferring alcohol dehydrogenase
MKAMLLRELCELAANPAPLTLETLSDPEPGPGELLLRVSVCGVCHTELDEIEGRTPPPRLPVVLGHQVVGRVEGAGDGVGGFERGARVGVAWIWSACGECAWCRRGDENLCPGFVGTGRDVNGGYAERMTVPAAFAHPIPAALGDAQAAPLLCAGAIGYRSLRLTGIEDGARLGLTGFGASGHLVMKMVRARLPRSDVFVFARDPAEREFATELGAVWSGASEERSPEPLDAIIDTTPVWKPVVDALANLAPGGRLVVNAIRKQSSDREELLRLDYPEHLWREKEIKSVANVTRRDVREFLALAADAGIEPELQEFALDDANRALAELHAGRIRGAKVLAIS